MPIERVLRSPFCDNCHHKEFCHDDFHWIYSQRRRQGFANGHGSVERVILRKGGKIERHNHPGKDVLVCVLRGNLNVVLDDSEKHALHAGDTLVFAGKHFFVAEAADDVLIIHIVINV